MQTLRKGVVAMTQVPFYASQHKKTEKPPLGLMPKWCWDGIRWGAIVDALERYVAEGKPAPVEWITELRTLLRNEEKYDET